MFMIANVIRVDRQSLLVRNEENMQEVLVLYGNANQFSVNDRVKINFNGLMTFSLPPQITATSIHKLDDDLQIKPGEMRAVVLRKGLNFLVVRNTQNRQEYHVEYLYAHHFSIGQRVIIIYNIVDSNHVVAVDIYPVQ